MTEKSGIRKPYREFSKRNIPKLCKELLEYLEPLLLQRGIELDFGRVRFTGKEIVLETRIIKEGSMSVLELQVESNTPYTTGDILDIPVAGALDTLSYIYLSRLWCWIAKVSNIIFQYFPDCPILPGQF